MNNITEDFEKKFQKNEYEMYILTESIVRSAGVSDGYFIPSVNFIASSDPQTGEVYEERGEISWIVENNGNRSEWVDRFDKLKVYKVRVRRSEKRVLNDYISVRYNSYLLTDVIEFDCDHPGLKKIAEEFSNRSESSSKVDNFKIRHDFGGYAGYADLMGSRCMVTLEFDPDSEKAERAYTFFRRFCTLLPDIDSRMRRSAASEFINSSGRRIRTGTDDIAGLLTVNDIDVSSSGEVTVYYQNDEVLDGGTVEVSLNYDGSDLSAVYSQ